MWKAVVVNSRAMWKCLKISASTDMVVFDAGYEMDCQLIFIVNRVELMFWLAVGIVKYSGPLKN